MEEGGNSGVGRRERDGERGEREMRRVREKDGKGAETRMGRRVGNEKLWKESEEVRKIRVGQKGTGIGESGTRRRGE